MDYEVQSTYNLTLIFNDGYEDSLSYQVAYSVGDVNEAPSFQYNTYNVKVNESDVSKFKYFRLFNSSATHIGRWLFGPFRSLNVLWNHCS